MKKGLLLFGFAALSAAGLAAAPAPTDGASTTGSSEAVAPQWLLNGDGLIGVRSEPSAESGHGVVGLGADVEYVSSFLPELGWSVGYDYLAESKSTATGRDGVVDLGLTWYYYDWSAANLDAWLKGGIGFNTTPNSVNGRYQATLEPGVTWEVLPYLAVDGGIQYLDQTPKSAFVQSFGVDLGLTVPLDAAYSLGK